MFKNSTILQEKKDRLLIFVCISPILVLNTILKIIGERTVGALIISRIKEKEKRQTIEDGLSVVAIAKDEGEYIEEWLAYYKSVGVNHVYLYENNGSDNMREKIQPFIDSGFVIYHDFPGDAKQLPAYN